MQTRTWRDRSIAWCAVLAWHGLAGWWLLHALPRIDSKQDDDILHVVYVAIPLPSPAPPSLQPAMAHAVGQPADTVPMTRREPPPATAASDPPPASTPSPSLVEQARRLVRLHADATTMFANDPFADRPGHLPAADAGRFRMRAPITPARVIAWVGSHVTVPAGYE